MGNKGSSENNNEPLPPQESSKPIDQPIPPCKPKVVKYSTEPKLIGNPCETHQGNQWCWPRYQVCDMNKITGCGKEPRTETLKCSTSAFKNNIIGIDSNLHPDLEGSSVSLKEKFKNNSVIEGFKEGIINSAAVESVAAQARSSGSRAKTKINGISQDVVNYGNSALGAIRRSKQDALREAQKAQEAAGRAADSASGAEQAKVNAESSQKDAKYYADVANTKMSEATVSAHDSKLAEEGAKGDRDNVSEILTEVQSLLEAIREDHAVTATASAESQASAERAKKLLENVILLRQQLALDSHVGAVPAADGSFDPSKLTRKQKKIEEGQKKINMAAKTLEELGKQTPDLTSGDISNSARDPPPPVLPAARAGFVPGRKSQKIEPFTLREGMVTNTDLSQLGADLVTIMHNMELDMREQADENAKNRLFRAKNLAGELLQQRRDIAGEIFSDYLTNDKSTNLHHVYQRKKQDNIKKERLVQTRQYEMNIYNEYLNLGKIVVIAFVLFVLAKVLNNKGIMGDSLTELFIALIIIITIIYIIWKLVWLRLRDPINFDKTNQGYDRQYVKNMQGNKYPAKKYNLGFLSGTCSGNDCCDNGMVYDTAKNICIVKPDGFDNIAGSPLEGFKSNKNTVLNEVLGSI